MELIGKLNAWFAITGAVAGVISAILPLISASLQSPWLALFIAFILFYISYKIIPPRVIKVQHKDWPGGEKRILLSGFLPFFLLWLIVWVLVYTNLLV